MVFYLSFLVISLEMSLTFWVVCTWDNLFLPIAFLWGSQYPLGLLQPWEAKPKIWKFLAQNLLQPTYLEGENLGWLKNGAVFGPRFHSSWNFCGAQFAANKSHVGPHSKQMMGCCPLPHVAGRMSKPRQLKNCTSMAAFQMGCCFQIFFFKP